LERNLLLARSGSKYCQENGSGDNSAENLFKKIFEQFLTPILFFLKLTAA